ncbi:MAG TPA: hypothetical protein VGT61_08340 [Thermomicrobiales bacterium]|nr:hypothetical protein [Thermomicrobiales bacterium]
MSMWGEDRDDRYLRPTQPESFTPGTVRTGLRAVPRWVWIAFAVVLFIAFAIALRGIPFFLLFFLFIFGANKFDRVKGWMHGDDGQRHGTGHIPHRAGGAPRKPTVQWGEPGSQRVRADDSVADPALRAALFRGRELAARMRATLPGIRDQAIRTRATNLVDDADRIVSSVRERGDAHMAEVFNDRYLAPATTILSRYSRIAARDLTTARDAIQRVEQHDLPLLQTKFDEFYEQIHRGDLIDLEVASEMLAFELGSPVNGAPPLDDGQDDDDIRRPVRWDPVDPIADPKVRER